MFTTNISVTTATLNSNVPKNDIYSFIEEDFEDLFNIVLQVKKQQYELTYKYYWNDEKLSFVSINENICSVNNNQQENVSNSSYVYILKDHNEIPYGFIYIDSEKNVTEYHYTFDGVGNIMGIIDGNGILACMYEYDALGNATCFDIENPICNGEEKSFMHLNPLLAKCYLYDDYSKLYINKNSYYSPELGKITKNKNINVYTYSNVFDCNPYSFCNNNFITKISTDGLDFKYTVDDLNDSIISKKPIINPVVFK